MNLIDNTYKWIPWVMLLDSWKEWPNFAISACTHGGEHAGLKVINYLIETLHLSQNLMQWKVFLVLSNIEAYKKSLLLENPAWARFIEENLNRCCDPLNMQSSQLYESRRARELEWVLKSIDIHLDIHSTYSPSEAIGVVTQKSQNLIQTILNVDAIYHNMLQVQTWKPFIAITERHGGVGIWLEAWCEDDNTGFLIGTDNAIRLLRHLWMVDPSYGSNSLLENKSNTVIHLYWSVVPRGNNFQPSKYFQHNEFVRKWTEIAQDGDHMHIIQEDSIIIMPHPEKNIPILNKMIKKEEYCFLWKIN